MAETLYRGGKGDYLEGGVRVPAMAWWPGVIAPGQTVGDIIHETDLFTTFAHLAGAMEHVPTDRIIDGMDQTALLLKGDTFSRRDYVFIYTGDVLAATVKGRYKRVWVGEHPGLSGAAFFDLYTDPRETSGKMLPMFPAKGMFNIMRTAPRAMDGEIPEYGRGPSLPAHGHRERAPGNDGRGPSPGGRLQTSRSIPLSSSRRCRSGTTPCLTRKSRRRRRTHDRACRA